MKYIKILLQVFLLTVLLFWPFAYIVRDGLGPNSVESTGLEVVSKTFMTFYIGPITIFLIAMLFVLSREIRFSLRALSGFIFIGALLTALTIITSDIFQVVSLFGLVIWIGLGLLALFWEKPTTA